MSLQKMENFLSTPVGRKLVERYKEKNQLHTSERDLMITNIVREHIEQDISMTVPLCDKIAEEIIKTFANEKKVRILAI